MAKSRLRASLVPPGAGGDRLALAFACDTALAALACAPVLAVTSDPVAAAALVALGAAVVPEPVDGGLNPALAHGGRLARAAGRRPVALTADLPALRPVDLAAALAAQPAGAGFVADSAGTGTTMLAAAHDGDLRPLFGPGSAAAHARAGARALADPPSRLRLDVDTATDLRAAARLGLGQHTLAALRGTTVVPMQATVARYDSASRSGTVLLDDGSEVAFGAAAFARSGLRLLRQGQRVRLDYDPDGQLVALAIPTMATEPVTD